MCELDNTVLLYDRCQKIKQIINKYGAENFYVSFSGGKDSVVLSWLIDYALPNNNIPRVFADTGIELNMIRNFVLNIADHDKRFKIVKPVTNIKSMLECDGYPFKSKMHSQYVAKYQKKGKQYKSVRAYIGDELTLDGKEMYRKCPKKLLYQFTDDNKLKISDLCCSRLKKEPLEKWCAENNKIYSIVGIMRDEGGRRFNAQCLSFTGNKLHSFQPLVVCSKEWEDWLINVYNIDICDIYRPPYNFDRTGCKGCPFALNLQHELNTLEKYFPNERKQCETIWKPVYDEYRRINYRLKG